MNKKPPVVGIDVSEKTFNAHFGAADVVYPNNTKGFRELFKAAPKGSVFAMEATGVYHYRLALYLHSKGCNVMVLNPYKVKHFIISDDDKANTDKRAARGIADYVYFRMSKGIPFWKPFPPKLARARTIVTLLNRLSKISRSCSSVNHAVGYMVNKSDSLLDYMRNVSNACNDLNEPLENELCEIVKEAYPEQFRLLLSIPGIGDKTASVLLVISRGMEGFESPECLTAFIGLAPKFHESGTSVKSKRRTSKTGNPYLRGLLFMCAWAAKKYNKPCKDLYTRLIAKGKHEFTAQTAVMHRLIKIAFGVVKSGEPYKGGKIAA